MGQCMRWVVPAWHKDGASILRLEEQVGEDFIKMTKKIIYVMEREWGEDKGEGVIICIDKILFSINTILQKGFF